MRGKKDGEKYGILETRNPAQVGGKTYPQQDDEGDSKMRAVLALWSATIPDWSRRNFFKMMKFDRTSDASNHNEMKEYLKK